HRVRVSANPEVVRHHLTAEPLGAVFDGIGPVGDSAKAVVAIADDKRLAGLARRSTRRESALMFTVIAVLLPAPRVVGALRHRDSPRPPDIASIHVFDCRVRGRYDRIAGIPCAG